MSKDKIISDEVDISLDSLLDDLAREQEAELSGVAGFVSTDGHYRKLFSYEYEGSTNSFIIEPTPLGKKLSGQFFQDPDTGLQSDSLKLELNEYNITQLSNIFQVNAFSMDDVNNKLNIRQTYNDPDQFVGNVKKYSNLLIGNENQLEEQLDERKVVLKEHVLDSSNEATKPALKGNSIYRYENNQLVSMDVTMNGLENAFKHAALKALNNAGIETGESRVIRSPSKGADHFSLLVDNQTENVLPATKTEQGLHYQVYERFNQAGKLPVNFSHFMAAKGQRFAAVDPTASANRILRILESKNAQAHENFVTSLVFNKLVGSKPFNPETVQFNVDVNGGNLVTTRIDITKSFMPDFTTSKDTTPTMETGKSLMMTKLTDLVANDPVLRELNEVNPEVLEKSFAKAIQIRNDMLQIIGADMVNEGIIKAHEADQFSTYLMRAHGEHEGFKADGTAKSIVFETSEDNQQRFQDKFLSKNADSDMGYN